MESSVQRVSANLSRALLVSDLKYLAHKLGLPINRRKSRLADEIAQVLLSYSRKADDREYIAGKVTEEEKNELFRRADEAFLKREEKGALLSKAKDEYNNLYSKFKKAEEDFKVRKIVQKDLNDLKKRLDQASVDLESAKDESLNSVNAFNSIGNEILYKNLAKEYAKSRNL